MRRRDILGGVAGSLALSGCNEFSGSSSDRSPPSEKSESVMGLRDDPIKPVRVGIIGLGGRGHALTKLIHAMYPDKGIIKAICDIQKEKVQRTYDYLSKRGQNPDQYSGSRTIYKEVTKREDIDLIFVFTHWSPHVPISVSAMKQGKHVAVEVPAAISIEGAWSLVNTAEKTQQHCMMLENVCYGEEELWVLNMVKDGIFGELTYGEAAYIHDLLDPLFSDRHYKRYRLRNHQKRKGNLYPTHGIGPIAQYMDILRGDRFEYLISMSSPEASLSKKASEVAPDHEFHGVNDFDHGDMNMSLIKTHKGRLIFVQHDVVTHRPYDRINAIAGTNGYHRGDRFPTNLSIKSLNQHNWITDHQYERLRERYNHPIWNRLREAAKNKGGHGGKDFIQIYRLFDALNEGRPLDMDVYDAATWSAVGPVSAASVKQGGKPVSFPDFTRGNWKQERELGVMKY